jgi:hypothetical protein
MGRRCGRDRGLGGRSLANHARAKDTAKAAATAERVPLPPDPPPDPAPRCHGTVPSVTIFAMPGGL